MNDFTKQELEELMSGLDWIIDRSQQSDITFQARIKLQYLIENYCQHESDVISHWDNDPSKFYRCKKCGEFYK